MIYNLNDSYYINQAVDSWLTANDETQTAEDKDVKITEERCLTDD